MVRGTGLLILTVEERLVEVTVKSFGARSEQGA
jgi:hypothetical protein